jgi:hypothetical protein
MTVAVSTGTGSGSSGSSETYGNVFSEAATAIGTAVSKLVPEEAELDTAAGTFFAGLIPDLLTGNLVDITAGIVGGLGALEIGLAVDPVTAPIAAGIALYEIESNIRKALKQKGPKSHNEANGQTSSSWHVVTDWKYGNHGEDVWVTTAVVSRSYSNEQQQWSFGNGMTEINKKFGHIGKTYSNSTHVNYDYGKTIRNTRSIISPNLIYEKFNGMFDYGRTVARDVQVDTPSRSYFDVHTVLGYGKTKTADYTTSAYTDGQKSEYKITGSDNYGKTTWQNTASAVYEGPSRTAVLVPKDWSGASIGSGAYILSGQHYTYNNRLLQTSRSYDAPYGTPSVFVDRSSLNRTSKNYGKTTSYKRVRTGSQSELTYRRSVDYGKSRSFEKTSNGFDVYGSSVDYGKTRTYGRHGLQGTSLYEVSRNYGATRTYQSGHTYERSLSYGGTRTYENGRTYERSSGFGQTSTYSNGVTAYHAINSGQTFTYRNGANYTHSLRGGRTVTRQNGSTSVKSRNSGASFTETLGSGQTRIRSIHNGATFTESKNGGATFLEESNGGRSYTYVHSGVEMIGRNYGQSYLYHNGAGVDFAYSPAIGGSYFGGSATQFGNGSIARHVLGLTGNASLPVLG